MGYEWRVQECKGQVTVRARVTAEAELGAREGATQPLKASWSVPKTILHPSWNQRNWDQHTLE